MPMLNVENMSSSGRRRPPARRPKIGGSGQRPAVDLGAQAVGQRPRDVLVEPAAGDVRGGVEQPVARERQHVGRVDRARLEQLVDERAVQTSGVSSSA